MWDKVTRDTDPVFSILLKSRNRITNVGLRVVITSFLIDDGRFKKGKVENISENEVKIFIDGTEGDVRDMLEKLRTRLDKASEDSSLLIPKPIEICEPQIVGANPHAMELPNLTDFAQSLMLEQTGKGVCVMTTGFGSLGKKFDEGFVSLGKKFDEGFVSLGKKFDDGFNSLGKKFDNMADILKEYLEKQR